MANLPQNSTYPNTGSSNADITYNTKPSSIYQNLALLRKQYLNPSTVTAKPVPGTPEYDIAKQASVLKYGNLLNKGAGVQAQTPFLPSDVGTKASIAIPESYGTFASPAKIQENGVNLEWKTPTSPVIRNLSGDVQGQYVEDTSDPNALIKTVRGENETADTAIRNYRPGFMYQIDHIMPLALGGADTLANRQLLNKEQADSKTRAQSVPYTLYAYGDISLAEARAMAMQWKDRDISDIPFPDDNGLVANTRGKTGIEIAREANTKWQSAPATRFSDVMAAVPQATKDYGKGILPDFSREFVKGFASGLTLGFVPYEQGEDETKFDWLSGKVGQVIGGITSFIATGGILGGLLKVLGFGAKGVAGTLGAVKALRPVAKAAATAQGLESAEAVTTIAKGINAGKTLTFKTVNKLPNYLQKYFYQPETTILKNGIKTAVKGTSPFQKSLKFGGISAVLGQEAQFVANSFNPYTLSGQTYSKEQEGMVGNLLKDFVIGASFGTIPPTLKGLAPSIMLPIGLSFWFNPHDIVGAITDGAIFGTLHLAGGLKTPGYNDIKMLGGAPYDHPINKAFNDTLDRISYDSLSYYSDILPKIKEGEPLPLSAKDPATIESAKTAAINNVISRFSFSVRGNPQAEDAITTGINKFSKHLEENLDQAQKTSESKGLRRFFPSTIKSKITQDKKISGMYGPGYEVRNVLPKDVTMPKGDMDLQTALTEVKRITVAARQLYKGSLTEGMRQRADLDDLLTLTKGQLEKRYNEQERFMNPPVIKQVVENMDPEFLKISFNNEPINPNSQYAQGTFASRGAKFSTEEAKAAGVQSNIDLFYDRLASGNASRMVIIIRRGDLGPLLEMGNKIIDPQAVTKGLDAPDPHPENALQIYGITTVPGHPGKIELLPLNFVAGDFSTNGGRYAFNNHEGVKNGNLKRLTLNKDAIAEDMKKNDLDVLYANLDPISTRGTIMSMGEYPFNAFNVNEANWKYSIQMKELLKQQENTNPLSMDIAKVKNAVKSDQLSNAINEFGQKHEKNASDLLPGAKPEDTSDRGQARQTTKNMLRNVEQSLNANSPAEIKQSFQQKLGIKLTDAESADLFNNKNALKTKDTVKIISQKVEENNADLKTTIESKMLIKPYIENGGLKDDAAVGRNITEMPQLGRLKARGNALGTEENIPSANNPITKPLNIYNYKTAVEPKPESNIQPLNQEPSTVLTRPLESADKSLSSRITNNHKQNQFSRGAHETYARIKLNIENAETVNKGGTYKEDITSKKTKTPEEEEFLKQNPDEKYSDEIEAENSYSDSDIYKFANKLFGIADSVKPSGKFADTEVALIKKTIEPQVTRDIILRLQNEFNIPVEKAETLVDNIINKKNVVIAPKKEFKNDLWVKDLITNVSKGDVLLSRRAKAGEQVIDWIDSSVKNQPGTYSHSFGTAMDEGLQKIFGKDYAKNQKTLRLIGRAFGTEGRVTQRLNELSKNYNPKGDINKAISQPVDYLNAISLGDRTGKLKSIEDRLTIEGKMSDFGRTFTGEDLLKLGPDAYGDLNIKTPLQNQDMVTDLTGLDTTLLPGRTMIERVGADKSGPEAIRRGVTDARNILQFIIRNHNESVLSNIKNYKKSNDKFLTLTGEKYYKGKYSDLSNAEKTAVNKKTDEYFDNLFNHYMERFSKFSEASEQVPVLQAEYKRLKEDLKNNPDNPTPAWESPEMIRERMNEIKGKINKYIKMDKEIEDGKGGPGIHDGQGGIGDVFGNLWGKVKSKLTGEITVDTPQNDLSNAPTLPSYDIRGVKVNDSDLNEISHILFSEISNRTPDKQKFEVQHIMNAAINRAQAGNPRLYGKTLMEVFQKPAQFQGYAPYGTTNSAGKLIESQYQKIKKGDLDEPSKNKLQIIKDTLDEIKANGLKDTTGGATFYVHASDGTIWIGKTLEEAKRNANEHEKKTKNQKTSWGTSVGMPVGMIRK